METEKSAGFILYRTKAKKREYLLLKCTSQGEWGFAKGHVEKGETFKETALREVYEETRIDQIKELELKNPLNIRFTNHKGNERELIFFAGETNQEPTLSDEHSEYAWVQPSELDKYIIYPLELNTCKEVETILLQSKTI